MFKSDQGFVNSGQGLVKHWVVTVVAECAHCGSESTVMLINSIQVECKKCGAVHVLEEFRVNLKGPDQAVFVIGASEPRIKQAIC